MSEDDFIVAKYKHNPVDSNLTPGLQILMDTMSGHGEDDLLLLKVVDEETRRGYKRKASDIEKGREQILKQIRRCYNSLDKNQPHGPKEIFENLLNALEKKGYIEGVDDFAEED